MLKRNIRCQVGESLEMRKYLALLFAVRERWGESNRDLAFDADRSDGGHQQFRLYAIPPLAIGTYNVGVATSGFKTGSATGLTLTSPSTGPRFS